MKSKTSTTTIKNIGAIFPLYKSKPIRLQIEQRGKQSFICRHPESNSGFEGDTRAEAVDSTLQLMVSSFEMLKKMPESTLGPAMIEKRDALLNLIERA